MKKTLVSALTTALVAGAASTAFAAANPFEDVPADHWAYDAVAQLAADGVIEGYGDGTYRGDQEITRYEMAQMVARAMAKGATGADKAMLDKLAAEFADELNNLGVRVAALEKKVDNVKWRGLFRYTYENRRIEKAEHKRGTATTNDFRLRLMTDMEINEHWTGHARVEYKTDMASAQNATGSNGQVFLNRAYVEGKYGATTITLGRYPAWTDVDNGMVFDDELSGAQVQFGDKAYVKLAAGRYSFAGIENGIFDYGSGQNEDYPTGFNPSASSYWSIEAGTDPAKKFFFGAAFHQLRNKELYRNLSADYSGKAYDGDTANIWELGARYRFDKNLMISGAYAQNAKGDFAKSSRRAWYAQLDYKGAKLSDPGSYGVFVAYRSIGNTAVLCPTYNVWDGMIGKKGWHIGAKVTMMRNVFGIIEYFNGKSISVGDIEYGGKNRSGRDASSIFARVECYF